MIITVKDKTGKEIDVSGIYMLALEGSITRDEYINKLDKITGKND